MNNEPSQGASPSNDGLGLEPERADFEAWFGAPARGLDRLGEGYKLSSAHQAWRAWQAGQDALRRQLCSAIRAADDKASEGDYMLDSNDCISVILGTWNPGA